MRSFGQIKVGCVICARNEREHIFDTVISLKNQTLPLKKIIVVDDGSTDGTGDLANSLGCKVLKLPFHKESFVGRPELAERWNKGLKELSKFSLDYVLILGADHPLPSDYIEKLVKRMEKNSRLVVASGYIKGEPYVESQPRGSGRLVKVSFWRKINNMQYPVCWGWESWLCFKAMQLGYETRCFKDIKTEIKRPTRLSKAEYLGKSMYALGYDWKYVLYRCLLTFLKSPKAGLSMFWGWFRHKDVQRLDIADWVNQMQKKRFWSRAWRIIKHRGKR